MKITLVFLHLFLVLVADAQTGSDLFEKAKKTKNSDEQVALYIASGDTFRSISDYSSAIKSYQKAEKKLKNSDDSRLVVDIQIKIANAFTGLKKNDKSINYLLEAKTIAYKNDYQEALITIYEQLAINYEALGDNLKATEYTSLLNSFNKEDLSAELKLELEQKQKSLQKLQKKTKIIINKLNEKEGELVQKDKVIDETSKSVTRIKKISDQQRSSIETVTLEDKHKALKLKHQQALLKSAQQMRTMLIVGVVLLLIIAGLIFYNYRIKKRDHEIISLQNEHITSSINYAKRIQDAAMPQDDIFKKLLPNSFVLNKPKDIVSGDFYWIYKNPNKENSFFVAAVDCTGHGVPGAFMSMIGINQLNEIVAKGISNTGEILDELSASIVKMLKQETVNNQDGMDMALCRIDLDDNLLEFSGARNPLVYIKNNQVEVIKADRMGIGGVLKKKEIIVPKNKFSSNQIDIKGISQFYIFTDGYADQMASNKGAKITSKLFYEKLLAFLPLPFNEQKDKLWEFYNEWRGDENRLDDVLVIGFSLR